MRRAVITVITAIAVLAAALLAGCTSAVPRHRTSSAAPSPSVASTSSMSSPAARSPHPRRRRHHPVATSPTSPSPTPTSAASRSPSTPPSRPVGHPLTVVLNPGHNGGNATHAAEIDRLVPAGFGQTKACDTTGTNTDAGYPEHAFTWDVALRVARILRAAHVAVVLTRHSDTGVGPCVDRRAAIGNHPWVAAVVSIHADGGPADGQGFHVNQDSRRPDGATARVARRSIQLGRDEHAALVRSSGLVPSTYIGTDGYYYRDDLAGLNLARRPATFLELGNMRNAHDAALLTSAAGRARIAGAVAAGILAFLGIG